MPTNAEELAFEVVRTACPAGGKHIVQLTVARLPLYAPEDPEGSHKWRACVKCGLRDTFIEEG